MENSIYYENLENGKKGNVQMYIDNCVVSTLRYVHRPDSHSIHITFLYTNQASRKCGYATSVLNSFIKKYGENFDITLECCPVELRSNDVSYKEKQEILAKFYEKFGFETTSRQTYARAYQWEMTRFKK